MDFQQKYNVNVKATFSIVNECNKLIEKENLTYFYYAKSKNDQRFTYHD